MDLSKIEMKHEGVREIADSLSKFLGGRQYLNSHGTPLLDTILLKALLAWEDTDGQGVEAQFTNFVSTVLNELYRATYFKVSIKLSQNEVMYWDCVSQSFTDFKQCAQARVKKTRSCDCFAASPRCKCLTIEMLNKQSVLANHSISMLLARHIFNRRQLNLIGMPLPSQQSVYSLTHSILQGYPK